MSLIADALKKAQQGALRGLPPLSFKRPASALPGGPGVAPGRRLIVLVGAIGGVSLILIGGLYLTRPKPAQVRTPLQPLVVIEPSPASPPSARVAALTQAPAAPAPKPEQGTSIPEVRAALEAAPAPASVAPRPEAEQALRPAASPARKARPSTEGASASAARSADPRRDVALGRVKDAVQEEAKQADKVTERPLPSPPLSAPRAVESPPSPPPVLEVHPESGKEAAKFFAAALRYHQQGQLARAIEEYEKSIAADPRNPAAYNNLGVALKDTGRLDLAIQAFQKCLALDPKYEKALNNLGVIRYRKGQYEEAIDLFKQALRINSTNVESYTNVGIIYLQAARLDDALEAFQQAVRHDPKLAEAHYNLGLLWERRGNREQAERHYQKFVELASERHALLVARVRERLQFLSRGR